MNIDKSDVLNILRNYYDLTISIQLEILKTLEHLEYKQKAIIYYHYMRRYSWVTVGKRENLSPRQCKNVRDTAIEKLTGIFSHNGKITDTIISRQWAVGNGE